MVKHYRRVGDVTPEDVRNITSLLVLTPDGVSGGVPAKDWLQEQASAMRRLPEQLQRPKDVIGSLKVAIGKFAKRELNYTFEHFIPECAVLCPTHKALNPWVIHKLFLILNSEPTRKLDNYRKYKGPLKTPAVEAFELRLSGILSLYTAPDTFLKLVGKPDFPKEYMPDRIASHCEACILAFVGASAQMLCDLRASLLARNHKHSTPLLLAFVDEWIQGFDQQTTGELIDESNKLGKPLYAIGKKIHRMKKDGSRRDKERRRLEHELAKKKELTAADIRLARGEIDRKLDEKFGKKRSTKRHHSSRHKTSSGSHVSSSSRAESSTAPAIVVDEPSNVEPEPDYEEIIDEYMDDADGEQHSYVGSAQPNREYDEHKTEMSVLQDEQTSWFGSVIGAPKHEDDLHPAFMQSTGNIMRAASDRERRRGGSSSVAPSALVAPLSLKRDSGRTVHEASPAHSVVSGSGRSHHSSRSSSKHGDSSSRHGSSHRESSSRHSSRDRPSSSHPSTVSEQTAWPGPSNDARLSAQAEYAARDRPTSSRHSSTHSAKHSSARSDSTVVPGPTNDARLSAQEEHAARERQSQAYPAHPEYDVQADYDEAFDWTSSVHSAPTEASDGSSAATPPVPNKPGQQGSRYAGLPARLSRGDPLYKTVRAANPSVRPGRSDLESEHPAVESASQLTSSSVYSGDEDPATPRASSFGRTPQTSQYSDDDDDDGSDGGGGDDQESELAPNHSASVVQPSYRQDRSRSRVRRGRESPGEREAGRQLREANLRRRGELKMPSGERIRRWAEGQRARSRTESDEDYARRLQEEFDEEEERRRGAAAGGARAVSPMEERDPYADDDDDDLLEIAKALSEVTVREDEEKRGRSGGAKFQGVYRRR